MLEIYDSRADTWEEVHTDASSKVLGALFLYKCAAAKYFHAIVYHNKKFNNV